MGIQIERYYDIESGSDGIYALGERRCDLILESWDTVRYTEPLDKYVLNKNNSVRWIRGKLWGKKWLVCKQWCRISRKYSVKYTPYKQADVIKKSIMLQSIVKPRHILIIVHQKRQMLNPVNTVTQERVYFQIQSATMLIVERYWLLSCRGFPILSKDKF